MKIIRYQNSKGQPGFATDGKVIVGGLFGDFNVSNEAADVQKVLAPLIPAASPCIGLNYRRHAGKTGAKFPPYPVLFTKTINTVQGPGGPTKLPTHLPPALAARGRRGDD